MNLEWAIERAAGDAVPGAAWKATSKYDDRFQETHIRLTGVFPDGRNTSLGFTYHAETTWRGTETDIPRIATDIAEQWIERSLF